MSRQAGYKHTEETKAKCRASKLGNLNPAKRPEVRAKISRSVLSFFADNGTASCRQSKEGRKRISLSMTLNNPTAKKSVIRKMSKSAIRYNAKHGSHNLGLKRTTKQREALSQAHIGVQAGSKHPLWNGGTATDPHSPGWTITLRRKIWVRDGYVCRMCYRSNIVLAVHHIDYNKQHHDEQNLISLCQSCHAKTNVNRDFWQSYFEDIMLIESVETTRQARFPRFPGFRKDIVRPSKRLEEAFRNEKPARNQYVN